MKLTNILTVALLAGSIANANADQALQAEAVGVMKQFGKALLGEVKKSMGANGPVATVEVCNLKAPQIAEKVSGTSGWDVSRTSLRYRNEGNMPDAWELRVLNDFEARKAAGESVKTMAYSETITDANGQTTFRFMKAIPTGDVCLVCHASEIGPDIEAKIAELYPNDKARGFNLGDIRGAFSLSKPM